MTTYGIVWGGGADTKVREYDSLVEAALHAAYRARAAADQGETGQIIDVVELEGGGPVYADDGTVLSTAHAPKRTLAVCHATHFQVCS